MSQTVLLKKKPKHKIAWLTLNRPEKLNLFNEDMLRDFHDVVQKVAEDKEIRVLIITGAGEKAFSGGADISLFSGGITPVQAQDVSAKTHELFGMVEKLHQPVIAAINGYALGAGCELALACDFRIITEQAKIGQTEVNLSLIPGGGGTQRMPRIIGIAKAKDAIFLSKQFSAQEALEIGLVDKVFPNESFKEEVTNFAKKLAEQSPIALKLAKQCINYGTQVPLEVGLAFEAQAFAEVFSTKDLFEGLAAFLQKRKPEFKGE